MRIAIDVSRAINEKAGIGRMTRELVKNIIKDKNNQYILIFTYFRSHPDKIKQINSFKTPNVEIRTAKIPGNLKEMIWGKNLPLFNHLYKDADILLAPSFFEFKKGLKIPQVVIIYDLTTFLFPDQRGQKVSERLNKRTKLACRKSQKIIAISESTKKDLIKLLKIPQEKIAVIYPGLNKFSKIIPVLPKRFALHPKRYILFVGTIEPRKNLKTLLFAYRLLPVAMRGKYPLIIVGAKGWNNDEELKIVGNTQGVNWLGYVSDHILAKLYREAAVLAYPSLYEGFGFPVIEAMQFGTPVVTANRSSLPEAAGSAGVQITPLDKKALARALQSVLEGKNNAQEAKKRREQANRFNWGKTAQQVIQLLEGVKNG